MLWSESVICYLEDCYNKAPSALCLLGPHSFATGPRLLLPTRGGVRFSTLWNLGSVCGLLWCVKCSRINMLRFKRPFKKVLLLLWGNIFATQRSPEYPHKEATRRKQTTWGRKERSLPGFQSSELGANCCSMSMRFGVVYYVAVENWGTIILSSGWHTGDGVETHKYTNIAQMFLQ